MKLEINIPALKIPEFKGTKNPLTHQGIRALGIVLGLVVVISGIVYATNLGKKTKSTVLPAKTQQEATVTPERTAPTEIPTITPLTEEQELLASPSPTSKVQRPTITPSPSVEGVNVMPTATE